MIERVHIVEDWHRMGHVVVVLGRPHPGAPMSYLRETGEWEPLAENASPMDPVGFRLPEGALDAIVAAYQKVAAPQPATERHLSDAVGVRDRLLAIVDRMAPGGEA
jgi:hypothetical protein